MGTALSQGLGSGVSLEAVWSANQREADATPDALFPGRVVHRMTWRYYGAMLSTSILAAAIGSASAFATGGQDLLPGLLAWIAVLLAIVNLTGAAFLYRPIRRYLQDAGVSHATLARRAHLLPLLSGAWVFALTLIAMLGNAVVARGSWVAFAELPTAAIIGTGVHCIVFAIYLGMFAYLLVQDHRISLRKFLWKHGCELGFPHRRFVIRLVVVLLAVGLGPVAVAMSDQWSHQGPHAVTPLTMERSHQLGQFLHQTLHMDVLGSVVLAILVVVLVARGLSRRVEILVDAMQRVDRGDLRTKAPVVSDDEFGILTARFNRMVDALKERERMRRTFAYFVPETVAGALLADEGAIEPQEREATILFVDIEQFTRIASGLKPREVVVLLNSYFDLVATIIHRRCGVITQFQGDAVLASFNLPTSDKEHARHALEAALEIERALDATVFPGGIRLRSRTGICSGLAVGGTVGGGERLGYTVHGDTVNLASRIEELNKELGTRILLSARTAELLDGTLAVRGVASAQIRGFNTTVNVFEPIRASA